MKTIEFQTKVNQDRTVTVPAELTAGLDPDESVRVILLVSDTTEERDWSRLSAEQFLEGYGDGDAIYDEVPAR